MTQDEIIRMAREAGFNNSINGLFWNCDIHDIERFAALVAAHERERIEAQLKAIRPQGKSWLPMVLEAVLAEREACAKVCEELTPTDADGVCPVAAAIRARGGNGS